MSEKAQMMTSDLNRFDPSIEGGRAGCGSDRRSTATQGEEHRLAASRRFRQISTEESTADDLLTASANTRNRPVVIMI